MRRYFYVFVFCFLIISINLVGCGTVNSASFDDSVRVIEKAQESVINDAGKNEQNALDNAKQSESTLSIDGKDEFYDTINSLQNEDALNKHGMKPTELVLYYFYLFIYTIQDYMWPILAVCWVSGLSLFFFAKGNPRLRKIGLLDLFIGGTVIVLLLSYFPVIKGLFS